MPLLWLYCDIQILVKNQQILDVKLHWIEIGFSFKFFFGYLSLVQTINAPK